MTDQSIQIGVLPVATRVRLATFNYDEIPLLCFPVIALDVFTSLRRSPGLLQLPGSAGRAMEHSGKPPWKTCLFFFFLNESNRFNSGPRSTVRSAIPRSSTCLRAATLGRDPVFSSLYTGAVDVK